MPRSALTSIAVLITRYVTPPVQIMAPILTLLIVNMLSCTAAVLHGNFPRRRLNSPKHCTSTQEENKLLLRGTSRATLSTVSPQQEVLSTNLCGPQWVLERESALFVHA